MTPPTDPQGEASDATNDEPDRSDPDEGNPDDVIEIEISSAELEAIEAGVIEGVLEDLPPSQRIVVGRMIARSHRGPLPSPELFAAYEGVQPGTANELLAAARDNRQHRFDMDRRVADTARLSLILTWACVVILLGVALVLGLAGESVLAGIFGTGGLAPVLIGMLRGGGRWRGQ